ncbi:MAG: hypothetical protein ACE37D_09620 [Pseudomonadales bacterium]
MAIQVTIDQGIRYIEVHGPMTNSSLSMDFREFWQSDAYDNTLHELYDFSHSQVTDDLDGDGLQALAELNLQFNSNAPRVKIAVLAQGSLIQGLSRQTLAYMDHRFESDRIKLFKSKQEAVTWLTEPS